MRFEFATATRIIFGPGVIAQAESLARDLGRRALVVTGRDPARAKLALAALPEFVPFAVEKEPDLDIVRRGTALAKKEKCDMVIGFGGGSALDAAKGIAALLTNDGDVLDYLEVIGGGKPLTRPSAPFLAIPTTAGTGSEVTRNAVFGSPQHHLKASLRSPMMLAKVALVDPELTVNTPPAVTASTGMDALTQLIEPYVTGRANPMTDGLCVEGIQRVARSLRTAYEDGHNPAAREDMSLAALFGGLALSNAGLGAVHGFAGVIGGMFPAPHGMICAALLPHVMAANLAALRTRETGNPALWRYEDVAHLLLVKNTATAEAGVEWVGKLVSDLKIPSLSVHGVSPRHIADIVQKSKTANSMKANPIVLTDKELADVLERSI